MPNKFYIEYFEPRHLKKANEMVEHHLIEVEKERNHCQEKIKEILRKPTIWEKIKKRFKFLKN
jgi:hypothetical protein